MGLLLGQYASVGGAVRLVVGDAWAALHQHGQALADKSSPSLRPRTDLPAVHQFSVARILRRDEAAAPAHGPGGPLGTIMCTRRSLNFWDPKDPVAGKHHHHGPDLTVAPADQQPRVPGQQAGIETRNAAENICSAMPPANPAAGQPGPRHAAVTANSPAGAKLVHKPRAGQRFVH